MYVDNQLLDIADDTKITLSIKSNLLRDVSKIVSNSTYTVKLPKTVHNQAVMAHCDVAAAKTDFPYMLHKGRYFRNGVEIIKDGRVVVLSSGTDIELSSDSERNILRIVSELTSSRWKAGNRR